MANRSKTISSSAKTGCQDLVGAQVLVRTAKKFERASGKELKTYSKLNWYFNFCYRTILIHICINLYI